MEFLWLCLNYSFCRVIHAKLCVSIKFSHQEIRRNFGILCSISVFLRVCCKKLEGIEINEKISTKWVNTTALKVSVFGVFLVRFFHAFGLSAFSSNAGKYESEKLWIRTLFAQWRNNIGIYQGHTWEDISRKFFKVILSKYKKEKNLNYRKTYTRARRNFAKYF